MDTTLSGDCRVYDKPLPEGQTKNEHFRTMLGIAKQRGFAPTFVCFDSWYSSLDNLKAVRAQGWHFLTRLKHNRLVNPTGQGNIALSSLDIPASGQLVHLKGFGFILVFRIVAPDGDTEYWATNQLTLPPERRTAIAKQCWAIENYHRGLKQCCGVERAHVRKAAAQKQHILLAVRVFVRLERYRVTTSVSWYAAKAAIVREAIRAYLVAPAIQLSPTA